MTENSFQAGIEALRYLLLEDGDKNNGSSLCVESGYWPNARKYLSSLTPAIDAPPTPDQGGGVLTLHQRAENFVVSLIPFDLENGTMVALAAEALLGEFLAVEHAAASEARAAVLEPLRPHLIARVERYGHTDGKFAFWGHHCKVCKSDWAKDAPEQHHAECALATPAPEGK